MKILVCTDGSLQSQKAIKEAAKVAGGCGANEVVILHVYDKSIYPAMGYAMPGPELLRSIEEAKKEKQEKIESVLAEAVKTFQELGIQAETLLKEGHPSETIAKTANEGNFDMVVIGSRGLGGLKKLFLGSVSNAVVQEVKAKVLVVK